MNKKLILLIIIALMFMRTKAKTTVYAMYTVAAEPHPSGVGLRFAVYTPDGWAYFNLLPYGKAKLSELGVNIDYEYNEDTRKYIVLLKERDGSETSYIYDKDGTPNY